MKKIAFVFIILLLRTVLTLKDPSFYRYSMWPSIPENIYKSVIKFNLTEDSDFGSRCDDNVTCSKTRKMHNLRDNFMPSPTLPSLMELLKNERCKNQISNFINGLQNYSSWAIEMFDASSKIPTGLITANTYQFGNFDQCVNSVSPNYSIKGKYCLANIKFFPLKKKYSPFHEIHMENEFQLSYNMYKSVLEKFKVTQDLTKKRRNIFYSGLCIPDSCTHKDAEFIIKYFITPKAKEFGYQAIVKVSVNSCSVGETKPFTLKGKILGLIVLGVVSFAIFCTIRDFIWKSNGKTLSKFELYCDAFSFSKNLSKFCIQEGDGNMNVFNGMKSLSMILIIMGHRCMTSCGGPFFNPEFLEGGYRKFQNILLLNGTLIVDTFFLVGGYLTYISLFNEYKKNKQINSLQIYLYRWLRITPIYMLVIFFYGYLLENIGSGPMWSIKVGKEAERCRQNWWTNFLYINNYVNTDSLCMFQSWYVSCDMHFILLAPLIFKIIVKSPKSGPIVFICLILGSLATVFLLTFYYKYDGVLKVYITTFEDLATSFTFKTVYIKTHIRATPYFMGMAAAYTYIRLKQSRYKFLLWQVWILSILAVIFALSAICGAWIFYTPGRQYNALENASYACLHRLLWAMSMSWIAVAGGRKAFGILQPVLSHKFFIPFSKLSYTAFLVHGVIQMYTTSGIRTPEHLSVFKLYWMSCGDVILSFFTAFSLYIFLEAPLKNVQKLLFSKKNNSGSDSGSTLE